MKKYKKILSIILCVVVLFMCQPGGFSYAAQMYTYGDFTYTMNQNEATIVECDASGGRLTVPSRVDSHSVTAIGAFAFTNKSFSSVTLPKTIKDIGNGAFMDCRELTAVTVPEGVLSIGDNAFYGCTQLAEVTIPVSVEYIGIDAFEECSTELVISGFTGSYAEEYALEYGYSFESLGESEKEAALSGVCGENITWSISELGVLTVKGTGEMYAESENLYWSEHTDKIKNIVVEEGITSIMNYAFMSCTNAETVALPTTLVKIGTRAFSGCQKLRSIDIGNGVESIGSYAFYGCSSLGKITLPDTLTSLGASAFEKCTALKSAVLPKGLKRIENQTFFWCESLNRVVLPEALKTIGVYAFSCCFALSEIKLNDKLTTINESAFSRCSLSEISFPPSVSVISEGAFSGIEPAPVLKGYDGSMIQSYAQENGFIFESLGEMPVTVIDGGDFAEGLSWEINTLGHLVISGEGASDDFYSSSPAPWNGYVVKSIEIEDGITYIGKSMFNGLGNITEVSIPESVKEIAASAFGNCTALSDVTISEGITDIRSSAFAGCSSLNEITIPSSVIYIANEGYNVRDAFSGCGEGFTVKGYDGTAAEIYAQTEGYDFVNLGAVSSRVVKEGMYNETVSYSLTNDGIMTINADSSNTRLSDSYGTPWYDWYSVREIVFGDKIQVVSNYVFENQKYLEKVSFADTIIEIGTYAFGNRTLTFEVYGYEGSVAQTYASDRGMSFVSLGTLPENEMIIEDSCGEGTFWRLTSDGLLTIYGNGGVDYSGWYEIKSMIKKVVVEEGVAYLGVYYAFESCDNLTEVVIADSVTYMDSYTFSYCQKLKSVKLSKSADIPYEAFLACYALEEVIIPSGVARIDERAFYDCNNLKAVNIPASVTTITPDAFSFCSSELVITGYSGTAAETYAKNNYIIFNSLGVAPLDAEKSGVVGNLSWLLTTDGTMTISGSGSMPDYESYRNPPWNDYKKYINKLVIAEGVTTVGTYAFRQCQYLMEIELPSTLKSIGNYAFNQSSMPEKLELPFGLEYIGYSAFYQITGLEEVVIPETVLEINFSFSGLERTLTISGMTGSKAEKYANMQGFTFNSLGVMERKIIATGMCGENLEYQFDNYAQLTINGWGWMYDYEEGETPWDVTKIETLRMSDDVEYIGDCAFMGAFNMKDVQLSENLIQIGDYAFFGCHQIPFLVLPESLECIDDYAFADGGREIVIPWNVTFIGENALTYRTVYVDKGSYAEDYCRNQPEDSWIRLLYKTDDGEAGDNISWSFDIVSGLLEFEGEGEMYDYINYEEYNMSTAPWYGYMNTISEIKLSEGITYIGAGTLQNITIPETVKLPSTVKVIGDYAFQSARIKNLTIPDGCTSIEEGAFSDNWKMEKIVIPASVLNIGEEAFDYCNELTIYTPAGSRAWEYANARGIPAIATGVQAKFDFAYAYANKATNTIQIVAGGVGIDKSKVFYVTYDAEGRYLETASFSARASADNVAYVRCFMWEDKNSMVPMCKPIDAKIEFIGSGGSGGGGTSTGGGATGEGGTSAGTTVTELGGGYASCEVEAAMEV